MLSVWSFEIDFMFDKTDNMCGVLETHSIAPHLENKQKCWMGIIFTEILQRMVQTPCGVQLKQNRQHCTFYVKKISVTVWSFEIDFMFDKTDNMCGVLETDSVAPHLENKQKCWMGIFFYWNTAENGTDTMCGATQTKQTALHLLCKEDKCDSMIIWSWFHVW